MRNLRPLSVKTIAERIEQRYESVQTFINIARQRESLRLIWNLLKGILPALRSLYVQINGKRVAKADLPSKDCPVCARPFAWRKKWARNWESVVYCSERCRRNRQVT
jgi:hypothetical protein